MSRTKDTRVKQKAMADLVDKTQPCSMNCTTNKQQEMPLTTHSHFKKQCIPNTRGGKFQECDLGHLKEFHVKVLYFINEVEKNEITLGI